MPDSFVSGAEGHQSLSASKWALRQNEPSSRLPIDRPKINFHLFYTSNHTPQPQYQKLRKKSNRQMQKETKKGLLLLPGRDQCM